MDARGSRGSVWDSDLVAGVAFHPRKCSPNSRRPSGGGGWVDSTILAADGTALAYRLYRPATLAGLTAGESAGDRDPSMLIYFHANAELCTDLEDEVASLFDCGFDIVLCPEFRGYGWSGGKPRLKSLLPDAECLLDALPEILESAGFQFRSPRVIVHGRSLGSACAVHLAAVRKEVVAGLVVESGVMQLLELPMVQQLGMMMPAMLQLLLSEPNPLDTLAEMRQVSVPTLIIHGDRDEISPVSQAVAAHQACGSANKKLVRYPRCHHNDLRAAARRDYYSELRAILQVAAGRSSEPSTASSQQASESGFLSRFSEALRSLPGMRRCLANRDDPGGES